MSATEHLLEFQDFNVQKWTSDDLEVFPILANGNSRLSEEMYVSSQPDSTLAQKIFFSISYGLHVTENGNYLFRCIDQKPWSNPRNLKFPYTSYLTWEHIFYVLFLKWIHNLTTCFHLLSWQTAIISHQISCNQILSGFPNSILAFLNNHCLYKTALVILYIVRCDHVILPYSESNCFQNKTLNPHHSPHTFK